MSKNKIEIKKIFTKRRPETHKGSYGKVFILAGSTGMLGAAILCSRGALRSGAGLVYLALPGSSLDAVNVVTPEVITLKANHIWDIESQALKMDAVAVGPGLGDRKKLGLELVKRLSRGRYKGVVVLDADGLIAFERDPSLLAKTGLNLIVTPHPGEMARLTRQSIAEVQKDRVRAAVEAARKWHCLVVLKGNKTVIADREGNKYINNSGNPGMATAATGDVLTGMIAGLAAQGKTAWEAATAGVYLHGLAGDLAAREKGEPSMIASDLVEQIPYAIQKAR
ncbi:MAG: NAD(P)H-hydrate dehydratase [Candidatus Margulisbacteria bacterium]|nr:NAD(P)H-hydrate dehydratase [Candidatus Margulisiibacteriota bacterium]